MKDLAHDDNLDIEHLTKKDLDGKGLSSREIDEIMKLKGIINHMDNENADELAAEINDVMDEIKKSAEHSRIDKEIFDEDDYTRKMHAADVLRDVL